MKKNIFLVVLIGLCLQLPTIHADDEFNSPVKEQECLDGDENCHAISTQDEETTIILPDSGSIEDSEEEVVKLNPTRENDSLDLMKKKKETKSTHNKKEKIKHKELLNQGDKVEIAKAPSNSKKKWWQFWK